MITDPPTACRHCKSTRLRFGTDHAGYPVASCRKCGRTWSTNRKPNPKKTQP